MDKIFTKDILARRDINTPEYVELNSDNLHLYDANKIVDKFGLPVVFKSACQGSSIGVEIINKKEQIADKIKQLLEFGDSLLIEQYVKGIELTVPIVGNEKMDVLPIIEIVADSEFYDYQTKYTVGRSQHIIPARISNSVHKKVVEMAQQAYKAVGCKGISRVDVIVDQKDIPYVIEINTSPGMTETSLIPDAAKKANISFEHLLVKVLNLALENN